ncbi:MAG TPA: hypothetical protein VER58_13625 [Thermoanaerobaculia bacterium]|nr:hypothetical protein [Thermoanaerobaculia bacterium]
MRRLAWLAAGALVIGTLDAAFAIIFWGMRGVGPIRIFQSIAAGLLGPAAFRGGLRTESLGLALHFFIAFVIVLVYWLAIKIAPALAQRTILYGAIYGVGVYLFMNYIVIPLSAATRSRFLLPWVVWSVIVHAFLIGVPATFFARKASGGEA